ncbi:hypothetical protein [Pontibacter vulgaris]|uniref:hypothetical protein n=1 Tax=Pontibacter vulgaris TaxID=2905679 RepID=UPI001FA6EB7C|nr:hypothetical protein [Pontibacter vulgaris]
MMKKFYLLFFAFLATLSIQAQDIIIKTDQSEIKSTVLEISDETIKYKQFDFQNGPVYNIKRSEVNKIVYANGKEEVYSGEKNTPAITATALLANLKNASQAIATQDSIPVQPVIKPRAFIGFIYSKQITSSTEDVSEFVYTPVYGFSFMYEKHFRPKAGKEHRAPDKGIGLASNNYFGYSETIGSEVYTGSRHYVTAYLFREKSIKSIVTLGGLAGGGMCYTRATADENNQVNPGESAGNFSGGAHLGLFAQKSLTKSKEGQPDYLLRLGWDIFIMSSSNGTLGANLSLSF